MNYKKGFTLIELLVVVAIIGILASVVLASLNSARSKGADAAIKSNLNSIRGQAELYYNDNSLSYGAAHTEAACSTAASGNIVADQNIKDALAAANKSAGGNAGATYTRTRCGVSDTSYAIAVSLKAGGAWCIDSFSKGKPTVAAATNGNAIYGDGTTSAPSSNAVGPYRCGA